MSRRFSSALVLSALVCTAGVPAAHAVTDQTRGRDTTAKSTLPAESSPTSFLKQAAASSIGEIELGKLAAQRGSSERVKAYGNKMVADHTRMNQEVKALAAQKNIELPTTIDDKHQHERQKLAELSGTDFDRAYMAEMTSGHEKVVEQFESASKTSTDDDVKALAARSLPVLEGHLAEAEQIQGTLGQASLR
jgi:putative membrane protein